MRRFSLVVTVIVSVACVVPIAAADDACVTFQDLREDPRIRHVELDGVPVNILLPPDYQTSGLVYPVLYLLHGTLAHAEEAWLNDSDLIQFTGRQTGARAAIVVIPGGDWFAFRIDWHNGRYTPDRFMTEQLIPYIEGEYRAVPSRSHRAVAGLSGGGWGALHLASAHPDLFASVGSFSGSGDLVDVLAPALPAGEAVLGAYDMGCRGGSDLLPICGGSELCWRNQSAGDLAPNLRTVATYLAVGNGVPCDLEDVQTITQVGRPEYIGPYNLEAVLKATNERLHARLLRAAVTHTYEAPACGVHTWRYWNGNVRTFWEVMLEATQSTMPEAFDHRRAEPSFSVWGWTFESDASRAPEFLDVTDASCAGVQLSGSGITTVVTGPCFEQGEVVPLTGAREASATADSKGRISFTIDLGSAHTTEQFTPQQRAEETAAGPAYWGNRAVAFG